MAYLSLDEALAAPKSAYFNASLAGLSGQKNSYYAPKPRQYTRSEENPFSRESSLCFDVSNQYLQASVSIDGTIQDARSARGLKPDNEMLRGVYVQKELINGGPWETKILLHGEETDKEDVEIGLLVNLLPLSSFRLGDLSCQALTFAPVVDDNMPGLPAVIQILNLTNQSNRILTGIIQIPECFTRQIGPGLMVDHADQEGLCFIDDLAADPAKLSFSLRPGDKRIISRTYLLGSGLAELQTLAAQLVRKTTLDWLNDTLDFHQRRLGNLEIEDDFYAENLVRFLELCRQAELYLPDGSLAGGTLGSNVNPVQDAWWNTNVWMKDNFYAALPMAMFNPGLCEQAILFYMQWGIPVRARGRGIKRYPDADPLTNSVSNALAGIILAAAYYQSTGNTGFFLDHPEFLVRTKDLINRLINSRLFPDVWLFPSMYVSDGDARGDFHTGTNLTAWYAINGLARICYEAYAKPDLAIHYQSIASRIKSDLEKYCKGAGVLGEQYFEGAFMDGTFAPGHDGEESDVALMPFYQFSKADDPALTRFSRLAFTPFNPHYRPTVDGIAWFDDGYACHSTFPGFTTALAGAQNEQEVEEALERIRRLTDLDGSIWWWPHNLDSRQPAEVARWPVKCCWAAGVYAVKFVNDILGIRIDAPTQTISFASFSPWKHFAWQGCRLGNSTFDFAYDRTGLSIAGSITNHNQVAFEAQIDLLLSEGGIPSGYQINAEPFSVERVSLCMRYGRSCYRARQTLNQGETLRFEIILLPGQ